MIGDYKKVSFDLDVELKKKLVILCLEHNTTITRLFYSVALALLTGDIVVKKNDSWEKLSQRVGVSFEELPRDELYSKSGRLLNPSTTIK